MRHSFKGSDAKLNMTPFSPGVHYGKASLNGIPYGFFTLFGVSAAAGAAISYSQPSHAFINLIIEAVKWAINEALAYLTEYAFTWFKGRMKDKKDRDSLEKMAGQGKGYDSLNETFKVQFNAKTFAKTFTFQTECGGVETSYEMKKAVINNEQEESVINDSVKANLGLYGVSEFGVLSAMSSQEQSILGDTPKGTTPDASVVINTAKTLKKEASEFSSTSALASNNNNLHQKARRYAGMLNMDSTLQLNKILNIDITDVEDKNYHVAYQRVASMSLRNSISHLILDREINKRFSKELGCWGSNQALIDSVDNTYRNKQWMDLINEATDPVPLVIDWARINGYKMVFLREEYLNNEMAMIAFGSLILNELDSPFVRQGINSISQLRMG